VEAGGTRILLDAGFNGKQTEARLNAVGLSAEGLQAIVITHEHSDHVKGAGVLARRYGLPLWMTQGTLNGVRKLLKGSETVHVFQNDAEIEVGDLRVRAFAVSHDAADPVSFAMENGRKRLAVATDTGVVTRLIYERLKDADLAILEANHDRQLLMAGSYPWPLKQRIDSNIGHLPNTRAAEVLRRLAERGLRRAVLAHLSQENNRPDLARRVCVAALSAAGLRDFELAVAEQDRPTPVYEL